MSTTTMPGTRTLVTGGAGFIGTAVCHRLVASGCRVVVVDDASTATMSLCDETLRDVEVVQGDLVDIDLRSVLAGVDRVVHLAGRPGVQSSWGPGFTDHLRHNVQATQRLLEAALDAPVERVVVASSSSVYGNIGSGYVAETRPVSPVSPYGVTKAAVELLVQAYADRGVPAIALRFFTVYGRGQRPDMALHRIIEAGLGGPPFPRRGDGTQQRDLTHVDDVAAATLRALGADVAMGTAINVGSGRPVSLTRLTALVEEQLGAAVQIYVQERAAGDPQRTAADIGLASRVLGWRPQVSLHDGIADQIAWHLGGGGGAAGRAMPAAQLGARVG